MEEGLRDPGDQPYFVHLFITLCLRLTMGHAYSQFIGDPETKPNYKAGPTFDPLYGFQDGRKERGQAGFSTSNLTPNRRSQLLIISFHACFSRCFNCLLMFYGALSGALWFLGFILGV